MTRPPRGAGILVAALVALAAAGTAAGAVRIKNLDLNGYPGVQVTAVTSQSSAAPTLLENGQPVAGLTATRLHEKSVVLSVDRSQSMHGAAIANATAAARTFVAAKPASDRIALFSFSSVALQLSTFSTDTTDVDNGLRALSVDNAQGTHLYDSIVLASLALQTRPQPRLLILITDGRDYGSTASVSDAVQAAKTAGVAVYSIGIVGPQLTPAPLRALARETGGTYYAAANGNLLAQAYAKLTDELKRTWTIQYFTAKRPGDTLALAVSAPHLGVAHTAATIPDTAAGPGVPSRHVGFRDHWWGAALVGGLIGLLVITGLALAFARSRKTWLRKRLQPWTGEREARPQLEGERLAALGPLFAATERLLSRAAVWRRLERVLERADVPLRAAELFYVMIVTGLVLALAGAFAGSAPITLLVLFLLGLVAPYVVLAVKAARRLRTFEGQLPAALNMLAGSLKAGHSFRQAVQALVEEGEPPLGTEFGRVLTEARLGRPMEAALEDMGRRIDSKELDFVLRAVVIQRQVGGSLAGLLELVAETLTQRQQFRQKVKSLTASGRLSALILTVLPFFVAVMVTLVSPGYLNPLFQTTVGVTLVVISLIMLAVGTLFLRRIVSFKGLR